MTNVAGSIESVNIAGRLFAVAADSDANRSIGGFENEAQANGNGTARLVKTAVTWMIENLALSADDSTQDMEYLQDIKDSNDFVPMSFTFVSGIVYQGTGQIVGELKRSEQNGTVPTGFAGPGKLTQQ